MWKSIVLNSSPLILSGLGFGTGLHLVNIVFIPLKVVACLAYFSGTVGFLVYYSIANDVPIIGEYLANIATIIEIPIVVPQIIKIFKTKTAKGVSRKMIGTWALSDSYKTIYFIMKVIFF